MLVPAGRCARSGLLPGFTPVERSQEDSAGARPEGRGSTGIRDPRPLAAPSSAGAADQRLRGRERSCPARCRGTGQPRECPESPGPGQPSGVELGRSAAPPRARLLSGPSRELQPSFRPGSVAPEPAPARPFRPPCLTLRYGRSIQPGLGRLGNEQNTGTATSGCGALRGSVPAADAGSVAPSPGCPPRSPGLAVAPQGSVTQKGCLKSVSPAREGQ